jgi:hypothetical protein
MFMVMVYLLKCGQHLCFVEYVVDVLYKNMDIMGPVIVNASRLKKAL